MIRSEKVAEIVAMLVVFGVAAAICAVIWYVAREQRIKRALRKARRWPIGALPENIAGRVVGTARPIVGTLTAPLSGLPCLCYVTTVRVGNRGGIVATEGLGVPFELVDDSGCAIVMAEAAEIALDDEIYSKSHPFDPPTPAEAAFLVRHGVTWTSYPLGPNSELSYREAIVAVGETIAVLGAGTREPHPVASASGGFRDDAPTRLRLTSSATHRLLISDDPELMR